MENTNNSNKGGGIGFTGLLQVAFIVLKLCNVIHWSWFWVLSPTIFTVLLIVIIAIIYALGK